MSATAFVSNDVNDYLALAPQDAAGTPGTTFTFAKYLDGGGLDHARSIQREREGGSGQDMTLAYVEHHTANANIPLYGRPDTLAKILGWAFGIGSITTNGSAPVHDFWPADVPRRLTFEQYAPQQTIGEQVIDGVINEVTLEAEHGKPLKVTVAYTGGDSPRFRAQGSARTVAYETTDPFYFNTASHQLALNGSYEGNDDLTKWTVTFTRGVDDGVFGVGFGRKVVPGLNRNVTVDLTKRYANATHHQAFMYGAGASLINQGVASAAFKAFLTNGLAGGSLRTLELEVPLLTVESMGRNVLQPDGETVYEDFSGVALKGATHLIRAQIRCGLPTAVASGLL